MRGGRSVVLARLIGRPGVIEWQPPHTSLASNRIRVLGGGRIEDDAHARIIFACVCGGYAWIIT